MIQKLQKISALKLLSSILNYGRVLAAYNKDNYNIDLYRLRGKKIVDGDQISNLGNDGRLNSLRLVYSDNDREYLEIFNGATGDKGKTGSKGQLGNKGENVDVDSLLSRPGVNDVLVIANDNETNDSQKVWSAYRGIEMENFIKTLSQIVLGDDEYQLLFNEQVFIDLEFTTQSNKDVLLINSDPVSHKKYIKYWTYEDESALEYYILVNDDNEYHSVNEYYIKSGVDADGNDIYTYSSFDIWQDYYLLNYDIESPVNYYIRKESIETIEDVQTKVVTFEPINYDGTYYVRTLVTEIENEITGETTSHWEYHPISKPVWLDLEFTTINEDVISELIHSSTELGEDDYVPVDPTEEEIIITHIPITSITIDGSTNVDLVMPIDSIITKIINITPTNYKNSPIGIEYDENVIHVFEDGRIMTLENNAETIIRIYSIENPNINAIINLSIVTPMQQIKFEPAIAKGYVGTTHKIQAIPIPANASDKDIDFELIDNTFNEDSDKKVATIEKITEGNNIYCNIELLNEGTAQLIAKSNDNYAESRLDIVVDTAVDEIIFNEPDGIMMLKYNEETNKYEQNLDVNVDPNDESYKSFAYYNVLINHLTNIPFIINPEEATNKSIEIGTNSNLTDSLVIETNNSNNISVRALRKINDINDSIITIRSRNAKPDNNDGIIEKQILLIPKIAVAYINLSDTNLVFDKGTTYQIKYTVNEDADNKNVIWSSSNPNIISVDENGNIECINGGSAIITAEAADKSGVKATCTVNSMVLIESIDLGIESPIKLFISNTLPINNITITPNTTNSTITLLSSNNNVFTVSNNILTGIGEGTAKLYAIANDNSGIITSVDIIVEKTANQLILSTEELELNIHETYTLLATLLPDDVTNQFVEFSSSNNNIVRIDFETGHIIPVSPGEAIITVVSTDGSNLSKTCSIKITE